MSAKPVSLVCPVCGAKMNKTKTTRKSFTEWNTFKCTCGHSEERKEDGTPTSMPHTLFAVDGFGQLPSDKK